MPRYFFHLSSDEECEDDPDQDGVELTDFATACPEAVRMCGSVLAERDDVFPGRPLCLVLGDDRGRRLARILVTVEYFEV